MFIHCSEAIYLTARRFESSGIWYCDDHSGKMNGVSALVSITQHEVKVFAFAGSDFSTYRFQTQCVSVGC